MMLFQLLLKNVASRADPARHPYYKLYWILAINTLVIFRSNEYHSQAILTCCHSPESAYEYSQRSVDQGKRSNVRTRFIQDALSI